MVVSGGGGGASRPVQPQQPNAEEQQQQQQQNYDVINKEVKRYQERHKMKIKYLEAEAKRMEADDNHDPYELYGTNQQRGNLVRWNNLPYHKKHKLLKEKLTKDERVKPIIYEDEKEDDEKGGNLSEHKITKYSKDRAKELGVTIKPSTNKKKKIDVFKKNKFYILLVQLDIRII